MLTAGWAYCLPPIVLHNPNHSEQQRWHVSYHRSASLCLPVLCRPLPHASGTACRGACALSMRPVLPRGTQTTEPARTTAVAGSVLSYFGPFGIPEGENGERKPTASPTRSKPVRAAKVGGDPEFQRTELTNCATGVQHDSCWWALFSYNIFLFFFGRSLYLGPKRTASTARAAE